MDSSRSTRNICVPLLANEQDNGEWRNTKDRFHRKVEYRQPAKQIGGSMANDFNPVAKTFSLRIKNKFEDAKVLALFSGTIVTEGLAKDKNNADALVFTKANPEPANNYHNGIDMVMTDGILPVMQAGELIIPETKSDSNFMEALPLNPQFRIEDLKRYLQSDYYLISRMIIKAQSQDQFDNPITLLTTSPTENLGSKTILPTNYSTPEMLQTTKIIIGDIPGTVLQGDTMMLWRINGGEVINLTFEFTESQK